MQHLSVCVVTARFLYHHARKTRAIWRQILSLLTSIFWSCTGPPALGGRSLVSVVLITSALVQSFFRTSFSTFSVSVDFIHSKSLSQGSALNLSYASLCKLRSAGSTCQHIFGSCCLRRGKERPGERRVGGGGGGGGTQIEIVCKGERKRQNKRVKVRNLRATSQSTLMSSTNASRLV